MAVTDQQKLDFLLKKIGYTKTKTGSVVGTGAISGTPKQPFAEAIPSPLVVPNSSLWNEAGSIPATAPGSDTPQVKVYLAGTSGLRMTADSTSSGQRAYIAYSTYGNTSSARLTNWIDTQFGASYLIKVYKGDPNSGGVALSAAGSGANDGWFFDYSAGVLNFNDTSVPSGVTDTNIYIVGYRYIGQTGAPTSGISTFSNLDLTVERNLDVGKQGGISTFRHNVQLLDNDKLQFGDSQDLEIYHNGSNSGIDHKGTGSLFIHTSNNFTLKDYVSNDKHIEAIKDGAINLYYDNTKRFETTNTGVSITGNNVVSGNVSAVDGTFSGNVSAVDATFSGNVSIAGTLTYEDAKNVDSVGLITARSGIRVTGGVIEAQAGENKIPSLYANYSDLPNPGTYHGMFAHVHGTQKGYFAHAGGWYELVNKETNGVVGTGTERYNLGALVSTSTTATSLNVTGVTTAVTVDINGDLDVDGHTNLDNVSVSGASTFTSDATFNGGAYAVYVNTGSDIRFANGNWTGEYAGKIQLESNRLHIQGGTSGIAFRTHAGANRWYILNDTFTPTTDGFSDIGSNSTRVKNIYADTYIGNGNLGIVTATEIDLNGDLDVDGHTNLDNVSVAGVSTFSDNVHLLDNDDLYIGGSAGTTDGIRIRHNGNNSFVRNTNRDFYIGQESSASGFGLYLHAGNEFYLKHYASNGGQNTVIKSTRQGAFILYYGAGNVPASGTERLITTSSGINFPRDIDVDGHTNLDNVSIAGVTTFTGAIDANGDLDVDGHTNLDNVSIAGVTTFAANARFNSTIGVHDGTTGGNGQYLRATGTGVTWGSFPTMRTSQTFTASSGQTSFSFTYNVGYLDVFVNGVKLSTSEFTANNGSTVVLSVGSFVGDIVELVSYFTTSYAAGEPGITELVQDPSPQLGGNLDLFNKTVEGTGNVNMTGVVTATKFVGDGSGLSGIVASGSGVVIKDSGTLVGTAGTVDFGANLSVSPVSAGIVTITGAAGGGGSGISTISGFVNIVDSLDVDGHTNLDNISVAGVTTFSNNAKFTDDKNISFGDSSDLQLFHRSSDGTSHIRNTNNALRLRSDLVEIKNSNDDETGAKFIANGAFELYHNNIKRLETSSVGISIPQDLDVDGHTNLDNISVAGVSTFTGAITASDIRSDSLNLKNAAGGATYAVFTNGGSALLKHNNTDRLETSASGVTVTGTLAATAVTGDGSGLTGINPAFTSNVTITNTAPRLDFVDTDHNSDYRITNSNGTFVLYDVTNGATRLSIASNGNVSVANDLDVDGHTNLDNVSIAGFTTITQDLNVDGHTNLDNVSVAGITTFDQGVTFQSQSVHPDGLRVGTAITFSPVGNATYTGIITAQKFVGDGSGLTGVSGSGSGVAIKDSGSVVGTAGTIDFGSGLNVTAISAGIVTVSTGTTSLSSGNSKVFVNSESSSTDNGSFEVLLQDNTSSGAGRTAFKLYQPFDSQNKVEFFSNNFALTSFLDLNCGFAGNAGNSLRFKTNGAYNYTSTIFVGTSKSFEFRPDGSNTTVQFTESNGAYFKTRIRPYGSDPVDIGTSGTKFRDLHITNVNAGVVTATAFHGDGSNLTGISGGGGTNVGITTNLSGSFTASAGTAATINTLTGYSANDLVVEYTIYIKNGSDFQTQKLLAMRDGTTIHSTQFAVMFSSSLLVQCDATISSGNILLRATPETGVSGSTTYKIKREVM